MRILASVVTLALSSVLAPVAMADLGPPRPTYEVADGRIVMPDHKALVFKRASDELEPKSLRGIAHIAGFLAEKESISTLRIEAHVDAHEAGTPAAAQALSEKRALAVARAVVARGVDCKRLLPVGFGDTKPVAPARSPSNTRVEARLAGLKGRAIGGMPMDGGGKVAGDPCTPAPSGE